MCIPYIVLEPIISKLSAHFWFAGTARESTQESIGRIKAQIEKANLNLTALLGKASIHIGELLELQPGDVIMLDSKVNDPVEIMVGSRKKYLGKPGTMGSKMAVQISSVLKEGDDNDE